MTNGYGAICGSLIRKFIISLILLLIVAGLGGGIGSKLPTAFIPEEDQGYVFCAVQLPRASSLQQTDAACSEIEQILRKTPGSNTSRRSWVSTC